MAPPFRFSCSFLRTTTSPRTTPVPPTRRWDCSEVATPSTCSRPQHPRGLWSMSTDGLSNLTTTLQSQPPHSRSRFAHSGTPRVHNTTQEHVRVNTIRFVNTFRTSPTPRGPDSTGGPDNTYSFGSPLSKLSQHRSRGAPPSVFSLFPHISGNPTETQPK